MLSKLNFRKRLRGKQKAKTQQKPPVPATNDGTDTSPSPAPSTITTSPTPPTVPDPVATENEQEVSAPEQTPPAVTTYPESKESKEEQPASNNKPTKKDGKSRTRKQEKALKVLDTTIDASNIGKNLSQVAQDVSGPLQAAFGVTERVLTIVRAAVANDKAWEEFMQTLEEHQSVLAQTKSFVEKNGQVSPLTVVDDDLAKALGDYKGVLEQIKEKAEQSTGRFKKNEPKSYLKQAVATKTQSELLTLLNKDLNRSWEFLQGRINLSVRRSTMRVEDHVARMRINHMLQIADARGASIGELLPGTRTEIIQKILSWADDPTSEKQIFWLCDGPGTGKSTIAAHVAKQWMEQGRLAGRFFFSREDEHTHDLGRFCATIAKQTIEFYPRGGQYLLNLTKDPSFLPFFEKFDLLIKGLLEYLTGSPNPSATPGPDAAPSTSKVASPLIVVIDSLDQCDADDQERLLNALLDRLPPLTSAKILLTSTPLYSKTHRFVESHRVLKSEVSQHGSPSTRKDIELYVRDRLNRVLNADQQEKVVYVANGVFQLASVWCCILEGAIHTAAALKRLDAMKHDRTFDSLYTNTLNTIREDQFDVEESINATRTVLQAIVLAYRPVTIETHHAFFPKMEGYVDDYVERIISWFKGIIKVGGDNGNGPVYILHPTFRTYLLGLAPDDTFNIAAPAGHAFMASGCFKLLEKLEFNLCGVPCSPDYPLPVHNPMEIPPHVLARFGTDNSTPLRYAVVFWARHAAEGLVDEDMRKSLVPFFETQLLKWIEWAAAIRELLECIVGIGKLVQSLDRRVELRAQEADVLALKWGKEALRFLECHKGIIDQSSMQVYYSALAFEPPGSLIVSQYRLSTPQPLPVVAGHCEAVHDADVTAIAVTRTGDVVASATAAPGDRSILLWDGAARRRKVSLEGASDSGIVSMEFSPRGTLLATGSKDGTIGVWMVGEEWELTLSRAFSGKGSEVGCLSFSEDEESIVAEYRDGTVGVWSIDEGRSLASYVVPVLGPVTREGDSSQCVSNGTSPVNPDGETCYISISQDRRTIALSRGQQLSVFSVKDGTLFEFLTIRDGAPAPPLFSNRFSAGAGTSTSTDEDLYWGECVFDVNAACERGIHQVISKASEPGGVLRRQRLSRIDNRAGPETRPASLLYIEDGNERPARIGSYRLREEGGEEGSAGVLLLPTDVEVRCWASAGTKVVVGTADGRVIRVDFAEGRILGKEEEEDDDLAMKEANSEGGYETADDGGVEGEGEEE